MDRNAVADGIASSCSLHAEASKRGGDPTFSFLAVGSLRCVLHGRKADQGNLVESLSYTAVNMHVSGTL